MNITIQKFGGTSVGSALAISQLYCRAIECDSDVKIVVSSAMSGVTDMLVQASELAENNLKDAIVIFNQIKDKHIRTIEELQINDEKLYSEINLKFDTLFDLLTGINYISEITNKIKDKVLSFGEQLSTLILYHYFIKNSQNCELLYSPQLIITDSNHCNAKIDFKLSCKEFLNLKLNSGYIYIMQGFIASDEFGNITTLGRGGSDYSAAIIAYCLTQCHYKIKEIEIWTDVDGIMTADPRIKPTATTIPEISYDDVLKLSYFGAKVVHPDTVKPAIDINIPVIVRNTFNPSNLGTKILKLSDNNQAVEIKLKSPMILEMTDYNLSKLANETNRLIEILLNAGSIIYYQQVSVYNSIIIFQDVNIQINDYIIGIEYILHSADIYCLIGKYENQAIEKAKLIRGIDETITLFMIQS